MKALWKGAISFGLIHIPVRLYSASKTRELKFKLLHKKDLSEIRYARICKKDGQEVPWEEIVKGYAYENGDYVVLTDEDFEKANVSKTRTIEILDFTDEKQIDTVYYETPYFLEPEKGAIKAYNLLREALKKSGKVAVGHFVLKNHEHLGVIKPYGKLLVLNQLRYSSELAKPEALEIPEVTIDKREIEMALKLIDQLTQPFNPKKYKDTYTEELKKVISKKAKGKPVKRERVEQTPKVQDIMSLLKESLEKEHSKRRKKAA